MISFWNNLLSGGGSGNVDEDNESVVSMEDTAMTTDEQAAVSQTSADPEVLKRKKDVQAWSRSTLPDLIVQALPDVHIRAPNVIIVGAQTSGKTKMFISLLFLYLVNHPSFTDEMGMALLRLFRTGKSTVTRRPTTVNFVHSSTPGTLQISLSYQEQHDVLFGSPEFMQLIEEVTPEAASSADIFCEEVEIKVVSDSVPNIRFTDMPGITTKDRYFVDNPTQTIKDRGLEMMADNNNTI